MQKKNKTQHVNDFAPGFDEWVKSESDRTARYATLSAKQLALLLLQADYHIAHYKRLLDEASALLSDLPALVNERERQARHIGGLAATLNNWPAIVRTKRTDEGLSRAQKAAVQKRKKSANQNRGNLTKVIDALLTTGERPGLVWSADDAADYIERNNKTFGYRRSTIKRAFTERRAHHRREAKK